MSTPAPESNIQVASISDRGLSEKRPMNEDSFLVDPVHHIFVVADGVGGADAGEVASQTAVEVLQDAFKHFSDGDDVEDLMELAIQRANASIHQMAIDNPRFSMMATTVVALHIDRDRATIGHVGDSRLYRVSPDGNLIRETADHSIVEEEVRAGRMTPEQAANHPSKNVISRALGAESSVEVDLKTIEVPDGSAFLLCTDGITRHIPDPELRELLTSGRPPEEICATMKDRCFNRGAEDNLTAVIVQVGTPHYQGALEDERTVELSATAATSPLSGTFPSETRLTPPSRIAFPGPTAERPADIAVAPVAATARSGFGRSLLRFFLFLLFIGIAAAAFYGGMKYENSRSSETQNAAAQPTPQPNAALGQKRAAVDSNPQQWLNDLPKQEKPTESTDPEFLYLYGRALMLSGKHNDAIQAFEQALNQLRTGRSELALDTEIRVAKAAAALRMEKMSAPGKPREASGEKATQTLDDLLGIKHEAPPK